LAIIATPSLVLNAQIQSPGISNYPRIFVDGERVQILNDEQQPLIVDGRVIIPLRVVSEALGFTVEWHEQLQIASVEKIGYSVLVQIGNYDMSVNGDNVSLDVPAQIINARTMLPLRAVSEATGFDVRWDDANKIVDILTPVTIDYWPEHLPRHVPGSVTFRPEHFFSSIVDFPDLMQFRIAFYTMPSEFLEIAERDEFQKWVEDFSQREGRIVHEMLLARFIQDFNVSREQFDAITEPIREAHERMAAQGIIDPNCERFELPNADIIFTFDNDIIRYFYRRV